MSIFWWKNMMDEKDQIGQLKDYNKNLENTANNFSGLALKEGTSQQVAYNWASAMVNKMKNNPDAINNVGIQLNANLARASELASNWRGKAAETLLRKRAVPKTNFFKSFVGGMEKATGDTLKLAAAVAPMIAGLPPNPNSLAAAGEPLAPNYTPKPTTQEWQNDSIFDLYKKQKPVNPFSQYQ